MSNIEGALPVTHPVKGNESALPRIKNHPLPSPKRSDYFSSLKILFTKHPRSFWREVKGVATNYLRTRKPSLYQDGKLTEADQKARISLILGAIALAFSWLPYTMIPAAVLAVLSIVMARKAREMGSEKHTGKGLAIAALIVAALVLLISVLVVVSFFTGINLLF